MIKKVFSYRLGFKPALLRTESEEEFYEMYSRLERYINPTNNPLLEMALNDIAADSWEKRRMQQCKTVSLSLSSPKAIPRLFERVGLCTAKEAEALAKGWMENDAGKEVVRQHLGKVNLDETAIAAMALEHNKVYELADKLQSSSESRLQKATHFMIELKKASAGSATQEQQEDDLPVVSETPSIADSDPEAA